MRLKLLILVGLAMACGLLSLPASAGLAGSLDSTFGTGGFTVTDFSGAWDEAVGVAVDQDGSVLVVGSVYVDGVVGIARYSPTGSLLHMGTQIVGGGPAGLVMQPVGTEERAVVAVSRPEGLAVARLQADDTLDPGFGTDGIAIAPREGLDHTTAVALQGDGKIVVTGFGQISEGGYDIAVARFNPNGSLDTSFGDDGLTTIDLGCCDTPTALAIDGVGRILVAGNFPGNILRLLTDGSIDSTYGAGEPPVELAGSVNDMALLSDGRVVLVGYQAVAEGDWVVSLLKSNGGLDRSFGTDGTVSTSIAPGIDNAMSVAIDADDRLIVAGRADTLDGWPTAVIARYLATGALDDSFATNGIAMLQGYWGWGLFSDVTIQPDGRIVVAGFAIPSGADFLVARYLGANTDLPPVISVDARGSVLATTPAGAVVAYTATATDDIDQNPPVTCTIPSGGVFPAGDTTVTCTAVDSGGNSGTAEFTVHVEGASEQLTALKRAVTGVGPGKSLFNKVTDAQAALAKNQLAETCSILKGFISEVRAQTGKRLTLEQMLSFSDAATRVELVVGCPGLYSAVVAFQDGWNAGRNPNGVWSYGWSWAPTGPQTLFPRHWIPPVDNNLKQMWDDPDNNEGYAPFVAVNSGGAYDDGNVSFAAGALLLSPGAGGSYAHVTFTTPSNGRYSVDTLFYAQQYGCNADINVFVNGKSVFSNTITDMGQSRSFAKDFDLTKGQTIDIVVGPNGQAELHPGHVGLEATITRLSA